ncbi:phytoene synthase [Rhodopseudomonas rhenobacensis]|uniref:Phytoene synthase n=1 Tax=Rhodopseudomonas rhenobacensis TaxID=87461 RepID=A0A7W8E0C4_9BRAD|nr:phytoene/squalene synthase family protein [Rhodopseudomonas rhenobacensis]MBB5048752.1 phytoene synthase [Rhodopseudomonas rhenobacensis]
MTSQADIAACREMLKEGSRTFHAASLVLPRRISDPAVALYAFCRVADDAVDLGIDRAAAVELLKDRLDRICRGLPMPYPSDRAFADVVARYAIPETIPEALIEGLEWDAEGRRYETLSDLYGYAARVAGTVGVMMTLVMGQRAPDVVARACDLGCAMQLTNIARDVGEDARAGRLYLPLSWMREAGLDPDQWLQNPVFNSQIASIVKRLLDTADALYDRATFGIENLPRACRPGIFAARALYAEIGREVERSGLDSVSSRAVVSTGRKLAVLARMLAFSETEWAPAKDLPARFGDMAETRFLIDAIIATPLRETPVVPQPKPIEDKVAWLVDLFSRLERRDQLSRSRA